MRPLMTFAVMGCSHSIPGGQLISKESCENKSPFTDAEVEDIKNFWDHVKRKFEETAKETLIRFFRRHPYFQDLFPNLRHLKDEQDMLHSAAFEIQAMAIFGVYDSIIENMNHDIEMIMTKLEEVAKFHSKIDDFNGVFFQYMEDSMIDALKEKLWNDFGAEEEKLMRTLLSWMHGIMTSECEAIAYSLIPSE